MKSAKYWAAWVSSAFRVSSRRPSPLRKALVCSVMSRTTRPRSGPSAARPARAVVDHRAMVRIPTARRFAPIASPGSAGRRLHDRQRGPVHAPAEQLAEQPQDRVVELIDDPLLERDDAVV